MGERLPQAVETIVVGGGTCGAAVAATLVAARRSVLLIEAGPDWGARAEGRWPAPLLDPTLMPLDAWQWGYVSAARHGTPGLPLERARMIGGCSTHNGCAAVWGHRADYDAWEAAGNPGWGAAAVLPRLREADERMKVRVPDRAEVTPWHHACLEAAPGVGLPVLPTINDLDAAHGIAIHAVNLDGRTRWNAAFAFLDPLRDDPNLRIVADTLVDRILFDGDRCAGVEVVAPSKLRGPSGRSRQGGPGQPSESSESGWPSGASGTYGSAELGRPSGPYGAAKPSGPSGPSGLGGPSGARRRVAIHAETVILAAGAYGSPLVLLRSGVGPAAELRALGIAPVLDLPGVGRNLQDHPAFPLRFAGTPALVAAMDAFVAGGGLPREEGTTALARSARCDGPFDLHLYPTGSRPHAGAGWRFAIAAAVMCPRSTGTVRLSAPDPEAPPIIDHAYFTDPDGYDLDALRDGVDLARELAAQPPLADVVGPELGGVPTSRRALRAHLLANGTHDYHPVGTCKMGLASDPRAVVDARGRVHGLTGLVVADAAIMPTVPRANTNHPALAVALHLARMLG